jgi:predicted nucleic acid-binding protein
MKRPHVLDASALLDLVQDGPGSAKVEALLLEARATSTPLLMSVVNWGEVYYLLLERHGEENARNVLAQLSKLSIQLIDVDVTQALRAGELRVRHKLPYVDSLAAALAILRSGVLVTRDRDFEVLGRNARILWLARS